MSAVSPKDVSSPVWKGRLSIGLAALALLGAGVVAGRYLAGRDAARSHAAAPGDPVEPVVDLPASLFKGWNDPELALVLSGQTFGYLQPCGCSYPQYGGLTRRYNVVKLLEKKGWKVAGVDLGEIYPPKAELPEQAREKFKTTLRALEAMNYQDFGLGVTEMKMPLVNGLVEMLALNIKNPRPVSLDLKDPGNVLQELSVRSYDVIKTDGDKTRVGVSALTGASVQKALKGVKDADFFPASAMIPALLPALAKHKVDVVVLLFHGTEKEAEEVARTCFDLRQKNATLPNVDLIVHASDYDTPPARPRLVEGTNTRVIYMGHKGKDIGVLGLFRKNAGGFELKYELVQLGPEFETPAGKDADHPVMKLMEDYASTIKAGDYLEKTRALRIDHPSQRADAIRQAGVEAKFVGSERCGSCHVDAFKIWQKTGHSHAFQTLQNVKHPSNREFDPECVACHTVGFKYRGGYYDPPAGATARQIEKHNLALIDVGCESCHGPGSMHANDPNNKDFLPLINPIKLSQPNGAILLDRFCQGCHDIENDVHWGSKKPFHESWKKIAHPTPK